MAWGPRQRIHTVYDVMEAKGVFISNPANAGSYDEQGQMLYVGPVQYPKMMYHPEGETRVIVRGEELRRPDGMPVIDYKTGQPVIVGEQREIIWQVARSAEEEAKLTLEGWHDHPAKAIAAGGGAPPPISSQQRMEEMERQIVRLQEELERGKTPMGKKSKLEL